MVLVSPQNDGLGDQDKIQDQTKICDNENFKLRYILSVWFEHYHGWCQRFYASFVNNVEGVAKLLSDLQSKLLLVWLLYLPLYLRLHFISTNSLVTGKLH